MDLRKAAKRVSELWGQGCDAEHHDVVLAMSDLDDALAQPDMLAEAVELLREVPTQTTGFMPISSSMAIRDFLLRYDEQQERTDA